MRTDIWLTQVEWKTALTDVADLKAHPKNPRRMTKDAFERLKRRISEEGFRAPITTDGKGTILAGHQRWRAAKELSISKVPVMIPSRALTDKEAAQILVADNVSHGDWDFDTMSTIDELENLDFIELGINLPDLNFEPTPESEQPRLDEKVMTECPNCGEVFDHDNHKHRP